jgi:transaldolase
VTTTPTPTNPTNPTTPAANRAKPTAQTNRPAPSSASGEQAPPSLVTMTERYPETALWNDSADPDELTRAISWGAVGATANPVIALAAIRAHQDKWTRRIAELARERPTASESEIGWRVVEEVSIEAARLLEPAFAAHHGFNGRLSMQTDPRLARDAEALVDQAVHFAGLAPNVIVKIPATRIGLAAIEEATYRGVSVNVTVSFTAPQAVAAGEAIERGLRRRDAEGLDTATMGPVVTIMVGRLDDWLRATVKRERIAIDPGHLEWAGVAVFKNAYRTFAERGLRARLLSAAFRNILHLTEFVGGRVVVSPPFAWQTLINDNALDLPARMDAPVAPATLDALVRIPEFRRAFEPDGLTPAEFDTFGATRKTLRQFLEADAALDALVRDVLIPAP